MPRPTPAFPGRGGAEGRSGTTRAMPSPSRPRGGKKLSLPFVLEEGIPREGCVYPNGLPCPHTRPRSAPRGETEALFYPKPLDSGSARGKGRPEPEPAPPLPSEPCASGAGSNSSATERSVLVQDCEARRLLP